MRLKPRHLLPAVFATAALLVPSVVSGPAAAASGSSGSGSKAVASSRVSSKSATAGSGTAASTTTSKRSSKRTSTGAAAGKRTHIVRSGDTVVGLAKKYGVSADSIRAANGIVDDELYLGARIIIDGSAAASATRSATSTASSGGTYTVKEGDYLEGIARRHGVSLSSLLKANGLKSTSLILPGDTLTIPGSSGGSSSKKGSTTSGGRIGPELRCPVPGASFMNDWGFPRDGGDRFHEGTDMFAPKGTTIVAPASGSLVFGKNKLGGTTFTITTPSGWVIYGAHMSATIGSSRVVKAGEAIGRVGNTGNAAGGDTHLHLSLKRLGGTAINAYPSLHAACG
jgi:LysM repeat protein